MQARSRCVLKRVPNGITNDRRFMRVGAFATVCSGFDELLGIVPSSSAIVQKSSHQNSADGTDHQKRRHDLGAYSEKTERNTHRYRHSHRDQARKHHLLQRSDSNDIDATSVIGLGGSFQNASILSELSSNFIDHVIGGLADSADRER